MKHIEDKTNRKRSFRDSLALIISGISLSAALIAAYLSYSALHEQRAVHLGGFAAANPLGDMASGYGMRVSLINEGLRPIIVRSMALEVDNTTIGEATGFFRSTKFLTDLSLQPDQPLLAAQSFPFTLDARSTRTMAALFDIYHAAGDATAASGFQAKVDRHLGRAFCRAVALARPSRLTHQHRFSLHVSSEPGGDTRLPVEITGPGDGGGAWVTTVLGDRDAPKGLEIRRKLAASTSIRLITVRVWRNPGDLVRKTARPLFGAEFSRFPFKQLPRGAYRVAIFDGRQLVAGGAFRVPLRGVRDRNVSSPGIKGFEGACLAGLAAEGGEVKAGY
jgi:hypothetical protein